MYVHKHTGLSGILLSMPGLHLHSSTQGADSTRRLSVLSY